MCDKDVSLLRGVIKVAGGAGFSKGESERELQAPMSSIAQTFFKSYDNLMVLDGIGGFFFMSIVKNSDCVIFHQSSRIGKKRWG